MTIAMTKNQIATVIERVIGSRPGSRHIMSHRANARKTTRRTTPAPRGISAARMPCSAVSVHSVYSSPDDSCSPNTTTV
jgi:hypothetical protein